jgi:hypothetical protein
MLDHSNLRRWCRFVILLGWNPYGGPGVCVLPLNSFFHIKSLIFNLRNLQSASAAAMDRFPFVDISTQVSLSLVESGCRPSSFTTTIFSLTSVSQSFILFHRVLPRGPEGFTRFRYCFLIARRSSCLFSAVTQVSLSLVESGCRPSSFTTTIFSLITVSQSFILFRRVLPWGPEGFARFRYCFLIARRSLCLFSAAPF